MRTHFALKPTGDHPALELVMSIRSTRLSPRDLEHISSLPLGKDESSSKSTQRNVWPPVVQTGKFSSPTGPIKTAIGPVEVTKSETVARDFFSPFGPIEVAIVGQRRDHLDELLAVSRAHVGEYPPTAPENNRGQLNNDRSLATSPFNFAVANLPDNHPRTSSMSQSFRHSLRQDDHSEPFHHADVTLRPQIDLSFGKCGLLVVHLHFALRS